MAAQMNNEVLALFQLDSLLMGIPSDKITLSMIKTMKTLIYFRNSLVYHQQQEDCIN